MRDRFTFLKSAVPFRLLPDDVLQSLVDLLQEKKYIKDAVIYHQEQTSLRGVDIIVEGGYESFFYDSLQDKRVLECHKPGDSYGGISVLLNKKKSIKTVIAKKGTLVYFLHRKHFRELCHAYEEFFHHFTQEYGRHMLDDEFAHFVKRPAPFDESYIAADQLYSRKIESIQYSAIVSCTGVTPVFEAARLMMDNKVGCLFIKNEQNKIAGYVTDITLRNNVVVKLGSLDQPVANIMDNPTVAININAYVYEAILLMFRTKSQYLLIEDEGEFKGFFSRNKLLSEQAQSPFVFIQSVKLARSVNELKKKWQAVPEIVFQLLNRGVNAEIVNQVITTVCDTIAVKVIEEVIKEIGKPPAKFVFMVLGSEGRKEQTLRTDQDNAIIYEDKANEQRELVREYFLRFAEIVSERLNNIGFDFCTGGFMAKNSKWTHSLSHWKKNYEDWMQESLPETVIKFSTFFDCRHLYGDVAIIDELKEFLDEELKKPNEKLFFFMAKNALQYEPPLTFFNNIRTITVGNQEVFDIKNAMTPIVDLVRVYALQNRIFAVNTGERLKALKELGTFTETAYHELSQSYYYLMSLRLKNQSYQIIHDRKEPDNYILLTSLTKIEQVTLKQIFKTIANFQSRIKIEFTNNLLS
ncbi:MAG: signal transduction protein [Segetibacter sp.]|nr:signal transduction protein [Segetibacter sp.]